MEFDKKQAWDNINSRIDSKIRQRKRSKHSIIVAAALISIFFTAYFLPQLLTEKIEELIYVTTETNEIKQITLPDGSQLTLNSNSRITYAANWPDNRRSVDLIHGEVIFNITKDTNRPFEVTIDSTRVQVLGTLFNINRYNEKLSVTLAEGSIAFERGTYNRILVPGERLVYDPLKSSTIIAHVNPTQILGWQHNRWVFQDMPLTDVLTQLAEQEGLTFRQRESNKNYPSITLYQDKKDTDLSRLLHLLRQVSGADIAIDADSIILK